MQMMWWLCRRRKDEMMPISHVQVQPLTARSGIQRIKGQPGDPYEIIFLDKHDNIVVSLTEWYRLRKEHGSKGTRETYLACLMETVQIDPFLINCGHDGRRDDRDVRRTTERSPGGTEGSNGALARDARAIEAGSGTNCRVGKAENASAPLHQGQ